jgi:drug/metabolite transporter (DMT)-like permease
MWALLTLPIVFLIPLKWIWGSFVFILLLSSILNAIATVTALKAVKYGELSIVGPLSAFTIPFLILSGYFILWEIPNTYGIFWVLLIFIWTYFLWISSNKPWFFWPIKAILNNTGAKYMLITALIWSITGPLDKLWIVEYWVFLWMLYINSMIALLMALYFIIFRRSSFTDMWSIGSLKKISIMTILWAWTLLLQMFATKLTLVIYVISIKRASWIFSVLLWYFFFQEKNILYKLLASLIMFSWVLIIVFLGNI